MEKQTKVLNKIKNSLKHGNEGQLGTKKNDECYTSMNDILTELSQWAGLDKFRGKNIVCPCDWDIVGNENIYSITITYKEEGVVVVGNGAYKTVESVQYDLWSDDDTPVVTRISLKEDEIEDFLRDKLTCNFVRTLSQNARRWGIKSITASGFNPATGKGIKFQDVDYSKYDVCVTNPPFSLYSEFMKAIVGKIDFIVLAPFLNRCAPCVIIPIMEHNVFLGFGIELHMTFDNPTKENNYSGTKVVNCDWITSFPEAQAERNAKHYKSGVKYVLYKDEYEEMPAMIMKDGTHPIRVSMSTYPEDYDGWMFATIGVLDNLDQETYEWYCTACYGYYNANNGEKNIFAHKASREMRLKPDGKACFEGIVFRKKSVGGTTND
jgi:hypothetical protein